MKKKIFNSLYLLTTIIVLTSLMFPLQVNANENDTMSGKITTYLGEDLQTRIPSDELVYHIMNKTFYIKNALSGQYLDVSNAIAQNGTNVQQYKYNGSNAQRWYINYNGDGTFTFYSNVGNNMVLDISNASSENGANLQIYEYNGTDAQKFKIGGTDSAVYAIVTKVSNYAKGISTCNAGCEQGENVHQYYYGGYWNERWILEPVVRDVDLGAKYANDNYNFYVSAYPNLTEMGGDCTNFVSQAMLASGTHYIDNWKVYRKNNDYNNPKYSWQLNKSWELSDPSPWISAEAFKKYWINNCSGAYKATGAQILENPSIAWNASINQGDVIQLAKRNNDGSIGETHHSMYISGYTYDGTNNTYLLTYHSVNVLMRSLLDICRDYQNEYFLFYAF